MSSMDRAVSKATNSMRRRSESARLDTRRAPRLKELPEPLVSE